MNHLDKLSMNPHGLYVQTHKSSIRIKVSEPKMYAMNYETIEVLSTSVKYTKWPSALAYDEINNEIMKLRMK